MPVDVRAGLLFACLIFAIPFQFYLSNRTAVPQAQREVSFNRLISKVIGVKNNYLSLHSWKGWCQKWIKTLQSWKTGMRRFVSDGDEDMGESPAKDLLLSKHPSGYFATSVIPRTDRPPQVKLKVGQVVKHRLWGYTGVVVGWDLQAQAPEHWILKMHPPDKSQWRYQPNYSVLVDTNDRSPAQSTYVPQENLEVIENTEVEHPDIWNYFDSFDGVKYKMRKAWQYFYPKD